MAKKTLGHIELQWRCPNCGGINPGPEKTCSACGSPQPEGVEFEQADRQELITDEEKISEAKSGPDIHCPYCGTRNKAGTEICTQCGGDLVEGTARESGKIVGAYESGPAEHIACPRCGADNPDTAKKCSQCGSPMKLDKSQQTPESEQIQKSKGINRWILVGAIIGIIAICGLLYYIFFTTDDISGTVQSVEWERSIPVEVFGPVEYAAFVDQIPANAAILSCKDEYHHTQDEPAENAREICGTPYNVDTGGGFAEVVQDCEYEIYAEYCEYTVDEWYVGEIVTLTGRDHNAEWPILTLTDEEREGSEKSETYVIIFQTDEGIERFSTSSYELFQEAKVGTTWTLVINKIGGIVDIEK